MKKKPEKAEPHQEIKVVIEYGDDAARDLDFWRWLLDAARRHKAEKADPQT